MSPQIYFKFLVCLVRVCLAMRAICVCEDLGTQFADVAEK